MSMFKKIKGLFIESDETDADAKKDQRSDEEIIKDIPKMEDNTKSEIETFTPTPGAPIDKKSSSKFIDILLKAIDDNNIEGFDYLEFKTALQNLSSMDMDEATRYKSAQAMAKTMNVSTQKILDSAQNYLNILAAEEKKFKSAVARQKKIKVTDKEKEIQDRKQLILNKNKQIENIKKEIENEQKMLDKISNSINSEAAKVQSTYENFLHAYMKVTNTINVDIKNIKQYLK